MCCDGIQRRFYVRIFSHSGDYPEKYARRFRPSFLYSFMVTEFCLQVFEI
jgi:hypothetical protein